MTTSERICKAIVQIDNLKGKIADPPRRLVSKVPEMVARVHELEDYVDSLICDLKVC